jgi:hypothetical protein
LLQRWQHGLHAIEIRGLENLRQAVNRGDGVLITPNHVTYPDPFLLYEAADQLSRPFYFMVAWQVFGTSSRLKRFVLQSYGCFTVNREGTDLRAFREAVDLLRHRPHPLVIFPEGEMYHLNDRVTPFHEGAAAIGLAAAKHGDRPIVFVPCALKYFYRSDPTPHLKELLDQMERRLFWRPRTDSSMEQRIYRLAEGALALKELEYMGRTAAGSLSERTQGLADAILHLVEERHGLKPRDADLSTRIKVLRQQIIKRMADGQADSPQLHDDLDDIFTAVQCFCYPGDYLSEQPSIERIAETLDKLEEDVLGVPHARVRGERTGIVAFGQPIPVVCAGQVKDTATSLTDRLEAAVQGLLDEMTTKNSNPQETSHADAP